MKRFLFVLLIALVLGILANLIWLYDVVYIKGWEGLAWLKSYPFSALLVIAVMIGGFLFGIRFQHPKISMKKLFGTSALLFIISYFAFEFMQIFYHTMYSRTLFVFETHEIILLMTMPVFLLFMLSSGYYAVVKNVLLDLRKITFLFPALAIFAAPWLGELTAYFMPGIGGGQDFVSATKMGYPMFWIVTLMTIAGYFVGKYGQLHDPNYENTPNKVPA